MGKIVIIGGGEIGNFETLPFDKRIVELAGKKHPKALLLPTASGDSELYWETFEKYFGKKLGCDADVLYLIKEKPSRKEIEKKILGSDILYVGGGNTLKMLKIWRKKGIDKILKKALDKNIVLSGLSAGAICWAKYGNSDSKKFGKLKSKKLIRLKGLNFVDLMICPHYDIEKHRKPSLRKMIKKQGGIRALQKTNEEKAKLLYDAIDNSGGFYIGYSKKDSRSLMNVSFNIADAKLESEFINLATKSGLIGLKGHRSIGGIRASIYNAMSFEGIKALVAFMEKFAGEKSS